MKQFRAELSEDQYRRLQHFKADAKASTNTELVEELLTAAGYPPVRSNIETDE